MLKKVLIIGLIVIIGLIGAAFLYLNHIYIPKHLKPLVVEILEKNLQKDVSIDKAFYFPFKGVLFSGVYIENQDKTPFLELEKVDLSLKSFPKIKAKQAALNVSLKIKGVSLKQQELSFKGSMGADIGLEIAENKKPVFAGKIKLENIQIINIKNISDITKMNGVVFLSDKDFSSEKLNAVIAGQKLELSFNGEYSEAQLNLQDLEVSYGNSVINVNALVSDLENPELESTMNGAIDLSDIDKLLDIEDMPEISGKCQVNASAAGPISDLKLLKADFSAKMAKGTIDNIRFSDLKAEVSFVDLKLALAPFYCTFYDGQISANAQATIEKAIPFEFSADIEQVDMQPLIKDVIGQDMGGGRFNAHAGASGNSIDLNNVTGSGWFKIDQATLSPPPNFKKVAKTLGVKELANMTINRSSATFSIIDGKIQTEDFIAFADYAVLKGKGYVDLEQYVDFDVTLDLADDFAARSGAAQAADIAADGAIINLYDKLNQLKYKVDFSVKNIIQNQGQKLMQEFLKKNSQDSAGQDRGNDSGSTEDLGNQIINQGLEKLFNRK